MNHKPFEIPKRLVWNAWLCVKEARGGPGSDQVSLKEYEQSLAKNLYKLWNLMSSGSYFPQPVQQVAIPKEKGVRMLGVPTVEGRIAQTVVRLKLSGSLEKEFLPESYGARPGRSAHAAIAACTKNCWDYDWSIDLDIRNFFDTIDHSLLMKVVQVHATTKWEVLYIRRWLEGSLRTVQGEVVEKKGCGIFQGSAISPLLSNLFLHYALDKWIRRTFDNVEFERFLDDCIVHCKRIYLYFGSRL